MPFPAVTVCAANSKKWPAMVEALNYFDKEELIFDVAEKISQSAIRQSFEGSFKRKLILDQFTPELKLDHDLPERLKLLPIERELFYLIHLSCYVEQNQCNYKSIKPVSKVAIGSILKKKTRQETAIIVKNFVCDSPKVDCSVLNSAEWMKCINYENNTTHKDWCEHCKDLKECLYSYTDGYLMQLTTNIFYAWRKYITKKNLIHALLSTFVGRNEKTTKDFINGFGEYFKQIPPLDKSNLTLLDAWAFVTGSFESNKDTFENQIDHIIIEALEDCAKNTNKENCALAEELSKIFGSKQQRTWENFQGNLYEDFIPLCSFASQTLNLKACNAFQKSQAKFKHNQCLTFNETSFVPKLGEFQGLNILVNYRYPGTLLELKKPITITVHEVGEIPDIMNVKGKNFYVNPGHKVMLKISTTVVDTTEDFDGMNFESRLCNDFGGYSQLECITDAIFSKAQVDCGGCLPIYIANSSDAAQGNLLRGIANCLGEDVGTCGKSSLDVPENFLSINSKA